MQEYIDCHGGVIAPLIFYNVVSSSLSNNGKVTSYLLVLSLGNIACELKSQEKGHMLLPMLRMISTSNISPINNGCTYFMSRFEKDIWIIEILKFQVSWIHDHFVWVHNLYEGILWNGMWLIILKTWVCLYGGDHYDWFIWKWTICVSIIIWFFCAITHRVVRYNISTSRLFQWKN